MECSFYYRIRSTGGPSALLWAGVCAGLILLFVRAATADECGRQLARVVSLQGAVELKRRGSARWRRMTVDQPLCAGDMVRVERYGRAAIRFDGHTLLRLEGGSTLTLPDAAGRKSSWIDLVRGALHLISRTAGRLEIRTPFDTAAIEGTELVVALSASRSSTWVMEGEVQVVNNLGAVSLTAGQGAFTPAGEAPRPHLVIHPENAVQWAIYYPPLLSPAVSAYPRLAALEPFREALRRYAEGDVSGALARLDDVAEVYRDARYFNVRAAMQLSVGRIDEARQSISRSLEFHPSGGEAVALQSIILLAIGRRKEAFALAQRAVDLEPQSPVPHIALSYAHQARFEIGQALESAQRAVNLEPGNGLARVRLAELWLMRGEPARSLAAAEEAVAVAPGLAGSWNALGFVHLVRGETEEARRDFAKAIRLDQAAPLPRLGLGLALIHGGELAAGREQMELAVMLSPMDSLLRSYLGKAYQEEGRDDSAAAQFRLAKQLDPNDPTPWLYDALRKQARNRPVEAAWDLNRSIRLNDNRAVYRSRLLLDEDLATRSAGVGRIYRDLGFGRVAQLEGWRSLRKDPANFSSHRLLADSYVGIPRHEMARVSELLQSLLLQPLNTRPYQPVLGEEKLRDLETGTALTAGYGEYGSLFLRDGTHLGIDTLYGSHGTRAGELEIDGVRGRFSYSIGTLEYQTDGMWQNGGQRLRLSNLFLQQRLSPAASLQLEGRRRDASYGDIEMRFDGTHRPGRSREIDTDILRLGLLSRLAGGRNLLLSASRQWELDRNNGSQQTESALIEREESSSSSGELLELQYLKSGERLNVVAGAGTFTQDYAVSKRESATYGGILTVEVPEKRYSEEIRHDNAYFYLNWEVGPHYHLLLGASYDDFSSRLLGSYRNPNPKLGLAWQPNDGLLLRLSTFRQLRRSPFRIPSLEPTQILGFNQVYDNYAATDSRFTAAAIDYHSRHRLFAGIELLDRDSDVPAFGTDEDRTYRIGQRERSLRAYLNWLLPPNIALGSELLLDSLAVDGAEDLWAVEGIDEGRLDLSIRFHAPGGLFASARAIGVDQSVISGGEKFRSAFALLDAELGYRFSGSRGVVSVVVTNLFDRWFRYQDRNFYINEPIRSSLLPGRNVLLRLSLEL